MEHTIPPTTTSPEQDPTSPKNYALDGKIMLFSVIGFVAAVFFVFFAQSCFRRLVFRRHRTHRHNYSAAGPTTHGLDLSVLKSLPTFAYSSAAHEPLLECSVCLSQFQNDEPGRVLPRCSHTFHVDCIDMWLRSHSNCPLCRVPVQAGIVLVREQGRVKQEAAGCSSRPSPPEPSTFDLLMGVSSLV